MSDGKFEKHFQELLVNNYIRNKSNREELIRTLINDKSSLDAEFDSVIKNEDFYKGTFYETELLFLKSITSLFDLHEKYRDILGCFQKMRR